MSSDSTPVNTPGAGGMSHSQPSAVDAGTSEGEGDAAVAINSLDALEAGLEIGPHNHRFRLMRKISPGDQGRVWVAQDLAGTEQDTRPRFKALKIYALPAQEQARLQEPLVKEDNKGARLDLMTLRSNLVKLRLRTEIAARLNHSNIVKVYGWRQGKDGWPFLEMDYLDQRAGCALDQLLRKEGNPGLGLEHTLKLLPAIAEALDYSHREHRLAHRYLKLEKVFISAQGLVKLLDFGLGEDMRESRDPVAAFDTGASSPQEAMPELQAVEQTRFKQDVSSLAALIYEMLTGKSPYSEQAPAGWDPTKWPMKPPELNEAAWKLLKQSLNPQSETCPPSAGELVRRLLTAQGKSGIGRRPYAVPVWLPALLVTGVLGGGIAWYVHKSRPTSTPGVTQPVVTTTGRAAVRVVPEPVAAKEQSTGAEETSRLAEAAGRQQQDAQLAQEMDDSSYAAAERIDSVAAYHIYLQRCPDCAHREAAEAAIKELETKAKGAELKAQFEAHLKARELVGSGRDKGSAMSVLGELESLNPQDRFVTDGKKRIAMTYGELARESLDKANFAEARGWLAKGTALQVGLEALAVLSLEVDRAELKAQDDAAYTQAERTHTQKSYQAYLDACAPPCGHRNEAAAAIERLKSNPPSSSNTVFRDRFADGSLGPELVVIPEGNFVMGSPVEEKGRFSDEHSHSVRIAKSFALGKYEVMFEEYDRFAEATGRKKPDDKGWGRGRRPVINVDWNDAVAYTEWLSAQTKQRYRLPTEAEWEYATRAGTQTARYWGEDPNQGCDYANGADLVGKRLFTGWNIMNCRDGYLYTAPVGSFKPNPFGLYDMLGNVLEWTCSAYDEGYNGAEQHCAPKERVLHFVSRGGSWSDEPRSLRSADRHKGTPEFLEYFVGFRLAREL